MPGAKQVSNMCRMHDVSIRLCCCLGPRLLPASATAFMFTSSTSGTRDASSRCDMLCSITFSLVLLPAVPVRLHTSSSLHRGGDGDTVSAMRCFLDTVERERRNTQSAARPRVRTAKNAIVACGSGGRCALHCSSASM
jgi:hypothetical protein